MADILIIDDDAAVRGSLRKVLEREGHTVREAEEGSEGERKLDEAPADLVILDLFMPGQEGIVTLRSLKRDHPGQKVLVISGGGERGERGGVLRIARALGADEVLGKPFSLDELTKVVEELLGGS